MERIKELIIKVMPKVVHEFCIGAVVPPTGDVGAPKVSFATVKVLWAYPSSASRTQRMSRKKHTSFKYAAQDVATLASDIPVTCEIVPGYSEEGFEYIVDAGLNKA